MSENRKTGVIIGNGFTVNFDKSYGDLYRNLKSGTYELIKHGTYKLSPAAKPHISKIIKENYKNVIQEVRNYNQDQLEDIFRDGVAFAEFISKSTTIIDFLINNKQIHKNKVAPDMVAIIKQIYEVGSEKGFSYVNIESWTALMWVFGLVRDTKEFEEFNRIPNKFTLLMSLGSKWDSPDFHIYAKTKFNGLNIFFRLLMITVIFNKGKACDLNLLSNINDIDQYSLKNWLLQFDEILSLNYDLVIEQIIDKPVTYLHGHFNEKSKGYSYFQSYSLRYKDKEYFTNNIILGDYGIAKVLDGIMYQLAFKSHAFTEPYVNPTEIINDKIINSKLDHIMFFGMSPENDYHLISGICYGFMQNNVECPLITYCYYNEREKEDFLNTFNIVIERIYSDKANNYLKNIKINFIDSKEIINELFLIKNSVVN